MTMDFTEGILNEVSEGKGKILDAGCGNGTQALFVAKRNLESLVHGYDKSEEAIDQANGDRERDNVLNLSFSVASHDDFQPPYEIDLIYTAGSLIGSDEVHESVNTLANVEDIVNKRLSRFYEMLSSGGNYLFTWAATTLVNQTFIGMAKENGFHLKSIKDGGVFGEESLDYNSETTMYITAMIFEKA